MSALRLDSTLTSDYEIHSCQISNLLCEITLNDAFHFFFHYAFFENVHSALGAS